MENNVTVILPILTLNESEKDYFANAIASVREQKVTPKSLTIVIPKNEELKKELESFDYGDKLSDRVTILENEGETDSCSQVNFGVSKIETEWFSVLELDDVYSNILFDNFIKYT